MLNLTQTQMQIHLSNVEPLVSDYEWLQVSYVNLSKNGEEIDMCHSYRVQLKISSVETI